MDNMIGSDSFFNSPHAFDGVILITILSSDWSIIMWNNFKKLR